MYKMDSLILLGCGRQSKVRQLLIMKAINNRYSEIYPQKNKVLLRNLARTFCPCNNKTEHKIKEQNLSQCLTNITLQKYSSDFIHIQPKGQIYFTRSSRQFHTSGRKDALPPLIWAVVSLVSKTGAVFTGRRFRNKYKDWLKGLPFEEQEKHCKRRLQFFAALGTFCAALLILYYYTHEQICPITGRKRFITLTKEQLLKVAEYETENFVDLYKDDTLPATHECYNYVLKTAQRIVGSNQDFPGMKDQKWVIHVVEDEEKNAFVLPNGNIFVFTGILKFVENEDQFAFVLGHEMSHALLLHGAEQLSYSQFLDKIVILIMAAIWTLMPNDGIAIVTNWFYNKVMDMTVHRPYSRMLEKEADRVGLHLMAKACYDVREGSVLWYKMSISDDVKGEGQIPEWLSTHPAHGNRVKLLDQLIPKALEERASCKCDRLPDTDPRVRAIQMRNLADNMMIARAAKANIERVHKDNQKSVIPTFQSVQPKSAASLDDRSS